MTVGTRTALAILAVLATTGALAACAANDEAPLGSGPTGPGDTLPAADGGADGAPDGDATPDPCRPNTLCPVDVFAPTASADRLDLRTRINVIRGRSPSDVWAVGGAGAVAHFDGTTWSRSETGRRESLRALWLRDSGELAFATLSAAFERGLDLVGAKGEARSPDGWLLAADVPLPNAMSESSRYVTAAWAEPGATWLWGTMLEGASALSPDSNNGLWRARITETRAIEVEAVLPPGACATLGCLRMTGIHGATADDLWAVGSRGIVMRITGAQGAAPTLTKFDSQTWAQLDGVWAAGPSDAFAVGGVGTIRRYKGDPIVWEVVPDVPADEALHAVWGTSANDVWAVGDDACVLHFDGTTWSRVEVTGLGDRPRPNLYAVWTAEPGHVWIGGEGVLLSFGGEP